MTQQTDFLLMIIALLGLAALGSSNLTWCIRTVAAQGIMLGVLLTVTHTHEMDLNLISLVLVSIILKGFVFPWFLFRSMRETRLHKEVQPYLGFTVSLVLGAVSMGVAFAVSNLLELPNVTSSRFIVPVSLANVFMGLLLLIGRKKAVSQVLGYLVIENGIFVFSLALATRLPALVEMAVLLDLFAAVFVMGITVYQISREFDHIDSSKLRELQDIPGRRRWPLGLRGHNHGTPPKTGGE